MPFRLTTRECFELYSCVIYELNEDNGKFSFYKKLNHVNVKECFNTASFWNRTSSTMRMSLQEKNETARWTKKSTERNESMIKEKNYKPFHPSFGGVSDDEAGINEPELIRMSGHEKAASIKLYVQLNKKHHKK